MNAQQSLNFSTKSYWFLIISTFVIIAYFFQTNLQLIIDKIDSFGLFAPLFFLGLYCLVSIFFLPSILLVLAGGVLFGPGLGTLFNLLGATMGATCGFLISRYCIPVKLSTVENVRVQKLILQIERQGWKSVALLRLTPAIPYNLVNYAMGLTRIKFSHYLIATIVFLIPSKIIVTYCGYYGVSFFDYFISMFSQAN